MTKQYCKYGNTKHTFYKKPKKHVCAGCGKEFPDNLLFSYVDGNNEAITKNSKDYCWRCYNEKYPNDRIGIATVLRQLGYKVEIDMCEDGIYLYINNKEHRISYDNPKEDNEKIIKEYDL